MRSWIISPDGQSGAVIEQAIELLAVPNNHISLSVPLNDVALGTHRLIYSIVDPSDPDIVYAIGAETFDVGGVALLGTSLERNKYPHTTDAVVVRVTISAREAQTANIALHVDDSLASSENLMLITGTQEISLTVPGPILPGRHFVTTTLDVEGLSTA